MRSQLAWRVVLPGAVLLALMAVALGGALARSEQQRFSLTGQALADALGGDRGVDPALAMRVADARQSLHIERLHGDGRWQGSGPGTGGLQSPALFVSRTGQPLRLHLDAAPVEARIRVIWIGTALALVLLAGLATLLVHALDRTLLQPLRQLAGDAPGSADELHAMQACMQQLRAQLDSARQALLAQSRETAHYQAGVDAASHSSAQFLALVGDRLRQPLQAMALFASALQQDPGAPGQREVVERLQHSAQAAHGLLDELLMHARLEARVVTPTAVPVEVKRLFESVQSAMSLRAVRCNVQLAWHPGPHSMPGDPMLLGYLLSHLVGNAIECARDGRVLVAARRQGDRLRLEVRDNGIGIARLHHRQVFEPFFQLGGEHRRRERKLGLGLAICTRIAALLDGRIGMRSELGQGSVFWVDLAMEASAMHAGTDDDLECSAPDATAVA